MKANPREELADVAAAIALSHQRVHKAVARKIQELSDGGLSLHEIVAATGFPAHLVKIVLRGGRADRPSTPVCAMSSKREAD
jgi:hypothetical protein